MKERVLEIMSRIFELPVEQIPDDASTDNIKSWNSLNHLNMVLALEDEFETTFADNEVLEMISLELILATLEEKGIS